MEEHCCLNCRWWTGDRAYAPKAYQERYKRGDCTRIHSGTVFDDILARLYPLGTNNCLNTRFEFACNLWEHQP